MDEEHSLTEGLIGPVAAVVLLEPGYDCAHRELPIRSRASIA